MPTWARGLMPVLVIPLVTTIVAGLLMILVLGKPISWLMTQLTDGLNSMSGANAILLGVILGLMMAFDMGGPLNKVAYSFAATGVGTAAAASADAPELKIMAAVMLAGMVPPIALALATVVRPGLFTPAERENGKAAWLLGASFITEGAIPFAAADPLRVIPAIMVGSAVTGGLSMALDVGVRAPHGGIFVLFAVSNVVGYLIALAAGVLVGAALVTLPRATETAETPKSPPSDPPHPCTPHPSRRTMPSKTVVVGSSVGLHARPAAIISEAAGELDSEVTLAGSRRRLLADDHDPGRRLRRHGRGGRRRPGRRRRDRRAGREGPRRLIDARQSAAGGAEPHPRPSGTWATHRPPASGLDTRVSGVPATPAVAGSRTALRQGVRRPLPRR